MVHLLSWVFSLFSWESFLWCAAKLLMWWGREVWFVVAANYYGVNIPILADFRLPALWHWTAQLGRDAQHQFSRVGLSQYQLTPMHHWLFLILRSFLVFHDYVCFVCLFVLQVQNSYFVAGLQFGFVCCFFTFIFSVCPLWQEFHGSDTVLFAVPCLRSIWWWLAHY